MPQTVIEKITQAHAVGLPQGAQVRANDFVTIRPDHVMTHDNTSAVLSKFRGLGAKKVSDPRQPVFALDHEIQNTDPKNLAKYAAIEAFAREQGIVFHPAGYGIGHQIMVEEGFVKPGGFVVGSDSHSNMYGGLGAVGTPIVRTDAAAAWVTGTFWWQVPRMIRVTLEGRLRPGVTGKDVIVTLCGLYNQEEVLNAAVEFAGPGVASLSIDERLAIANMTTEWGALVGWFPVDAVTIAYLRYRAAKLRARGLGDRLTDADISAWEKDPPRSDPDATYAAEIVLDLGQVSPYVSGPDTVQTASPLSELTAERIPVQKAYLVSCVNSRLTDLQAAAKVIRGKKVAPAVKFYVAAASKSVQEAAEADGSWQALLDAGAEPLPPGCGPCIGLGTGLLEPGEVGISATNRNFKGRMGSREAKCYLASPAVVAASAVAGYITGPDGIPVESMLLKKNFREFAARRAEVRVEIIPGFPPRIEGRALLLPQDNLNTDGIYGKDYTYRDDMTREMMAQVVMANYDPAFTALAQPGDVIVGGFNFGTGSSREQAVTALQAARITLVIAGSFSQTYLRNAFNNGYACVESPDLVKALKAAFAERAKAGEKTIVAGDTVALDFVRAVVTWRGHDYGFAALGTAVQELVVAGGVENQVRKQIAGG
jgi:homoaconitate hydratase